LLRLVNVVQEYGEGGSVFVALKGVSLEVGEGEFVGIVGSSGSGKTTLLNIIACLHRPRSGEVWLDSQRVDTANEAELATIRNEKIGFIFQSFCLLPRLSAVANVEVPLTYRGVPRRERWRRATEALEMVGMADKLANKPTELSGGQQQRVAIARALVGRPRLLLADEPTGNLDSETGSFVLDLIADLHEQGNTVVLVSHEKSIADRCETIFEVSDGEVAPRDGDR